MRVTVDGETYYLNDTDQYAKLGATGTTAGGPRALHPGAEIIEAAKECEDRAETDYTLSIRENGQTRVGVTRRYYGDYYAGKNRYFSELPPEERRRYYQEIVSRRGAGRAAGGRFENAISTPIPAWSNSRWTSTTTAWWMANIFTSICPSRPACSRRARTSARCRSLFNRTDRNIVRTEIELPQQFRHEVIAPPKPRPERAQRRRSARITATDSPGKWVITDEFATLPAIIEPGNYPAPCKTGVGTGAPIVAGLSLLLRQTVSAAGEDNARPRPRWAWPEGGEVLGIGLLAALALWRLAESWRKWA